MNVTVPLARRSRPQRTKKQSDPNRRAFADLALDCHPAPVGLDDAPADRQTQTSAARAGGSSGIDPVEPLAEMTAALEAIPAIERLEALTERLLDAESWEELLAG